MSLCRRSSGLLSCVGTFVALWLATPDAFASPCTAMPVLPPIAQMTFGGAIVESVLATHARLEAGERPKVIWIVGDNGAWYCPTRDIVAVSVGLLDYAWRGRATDGADILAFAVAHELAHRRFDAARHRGEPLATHACPDEETARREARADERAAFLMALAHNPWSNRAHSPFNLVRRDALKALLEHEHGWAPECEATTRRLEGLARATARMAELGAMYEAATLLAFIPDDGREVALRVLERMAHASSGPWTSLPELDLLRAIVHLDRAQRALSWCPPDLVAAGLVPDPCALTCSVPFPTHAALSPFDAIGRRTRSDEIGRVELANARRLLAAARQKGIDVNQVTGVDVCIAYAEAAPERGLALLGNRADERAQEVRALLELQRRLLTATGPIYTAPWFSEVGTWRDETPLPSPTPLLPQPEPCTIEHTFALDRWSISVGPRCMDLRGPETRYALRDAPPDGKVAPWHTHCAMTRAGYGDDGTRVQGARCPGDDATWLVWSRGEHVTRLTRVQRTGR